MVKRVLAFLFGIILIISVVAINPDVIEAKRVKKSGWYSTAATKKNTDKGIDLPFLKKYKLKGKTLITYGSFFYYKRKWNDKIIKAKKRTFRISSKCKYYEYHNAGNVRLSKQQLFKKVRQSMKRKYIVEGIDIRVKNRKVVKMFFGQF